jgi:hypothetical protein
VNIKRATAMSVKKADRGEEYPFSLSFSNFSLSENLMSPILTSRTKRTRDTKVKTVTIMMKKFLFLSMNSLTAASEPVER